MKVRLIDSLTYTILDQFSLDKTLSETIKYLNSKYIGEVECGNGCVSFYIRHVKGV